MSEMDVRAVVGVTVCDKREASCRCREPFGHDGPHRCHPDCGGAWTYDEQGRFDVVEWPAGVAVPGLGAEDVW